MVNAPLAVCLPLTLTTASVSEHVTINGTAVGWKQLHAARKAADTTAPKNPNTMLFENFMAPMYRIFRRGDKPKTNGAAGLQPAVKSMRRLPIVRKSLDGGLQTRRSVFSFVHGQQNAFLL